MASAGFAVTISATDAASARIDAINKRLAAMRAPVERVTGSLQKFADLSGISSLQRGLARTSERAISLARSLANVVEPLGVITGAASIAGMARFVASWAESGASLGYAAQRAGMTVEQLQTLQGAARLSGSSAEALTSGITSLNDALVNVRGGRSADAAVALRSLGIELNNADGSAKTGAQAFVELIGKISSMPNPTLQQRNALILLGGAANELWPVITGGTRAFQENIKEAQRFGVMNTEGAKQAKALKRDYDQLSLAVQGLGFAVAEKAGPRMGQFLDMLTGIVVGLRQAMGASDDLKRKMDAYENVHPAVKLPLTTRIDDYIRQHPLNGLPLNPVGGDDTGGFVPFAPDHPVAPWGGRIGAHPALPAPTRVPGQLAPDIEHEVVMQALRQGIDPNRAVALFRTEAGGYNRVSPAGAFGPAQLMPGTARELGVADDPNAPGYDWRQNVAAGVRYFAQQYQRFGNYDAAEAAYNAGPGGRGVGRFAATGDPSDLPNETQRYVSTIDRLTLGARTAALSLDSGATGGGQGAPGPSGKAELIVTVQGETRGVRTTTRATGDIWDGAPRVQRTMPQTAGTG